MSFELLYRSIFFFQAEDGIRGLVRSRGLGDVYKRQHMPGDPVRRINWRATQRHGRLYINDSLRDRNIDVCLLYTSDAADDLLCVDLGGRRIIKKKNITKTTTKQQFIMLHIQNMST